MSKMFFVNLPVADLAQSTAFYEAIGFTKNAAFSNDQASCMVWSDTLYVMLLVRPFYATFTDKPVGDAKTSSSVLLCMSLEDRAGVDALWAKAMAAGAHPARALQVHGTMYHGFFDDPDGHTWEPFWMEMPEAASAG